MNNILLCSNYLPSFLPNMRGEYAVIKFCRLLTIFFLHFSLFFCKSFPVISVALPPTQFYFNFFNHNLSTPILCIYLPNPSTLPPPPTFSSMQIHQMMFTFTNLFITQQLRIVMPPPNLNL